MVDIKSQSVSKGDAIQIMVRPSESLDAGTYQSNFTLELDPGDEGQVIRLTIPVKIVRY